MELNTIEEAIAGDLIITEVDASNTRSSGAHRSVGFEVLHTYHANHRNWELIGLEI